MTFVRSLVSTPNPAGTSPNHGNALNSVRCTSATNCWAGGTYGTVTAISQSTEHNQILHWNGKKWSSHTTAGKPRLNEALHWNGAKWSAFSTPDPGGTGMSDTNVLNSARCTKAANCWAVGFAG